MSNIDVFIDTLPIIGIGYGGVFGVTLLVVLAIKLIGYIKIDRK